jgi:hypothetical protein
MTQHALLAAAWTPLWRTELGIRWFHTARIVRKNLPNVVACIRRNLLCQRQREQRDLLQRPCSVFMNFELKNMAYSFGYKRWHAAECVAAAVVCRFVIGVFAIACYF